MAVITISRQIGSGGDTIAHQVCETLRYRYFDKQLLIEAAADVGLDHDHVVDYSEDQYETRTMMARLLRSGPRPIKKVSIKQRDSAGQETLTEETINEAQYVELVKNSLVAAYEADDIVIVGRGGQAVLQDKDNVLHVRIIAPMGSRITRLVDEKGLSVEAAQNLINERDRATAEYLGRFFGVRWNDTTLYHLVINTGKLNLNGAAQIIVDAVVQLRASIAG